MKSFWPQRFSPVSTSSFNGKTAIISQISLNPGKDTGRWCFRTPPLQFLKLFLLTFSLNGLVAPLF